MPSPHSPKTLMVNGQSHTALVEDRETLLEVLRYKLKLVGTKQGCDKGDCGACTVLIAGSAQLSCLTLAHDVGAEDITTIESYATDELTTLLVDAFDGAGALQCGFCQPGMILSSYVLLKENAKPSLFDIKLALSGNLCRCTGYTKIYAAVFAASLVVNKATATLEDALRVVEQEKPHLEAAHV